MLSLLIIQLPIYADNPISSFARRDLALKNARAFALTEAAERGDTHVVILLLHAGADPNAVGKFGETPLIAAAMHKQLQVAAILLDYHADVDRTANEFGETPLIWATRAGDLPMVRFLLAHNASVDARSTSFTVGLGRETPLVIAEEYKDVVLAQVLLEAHADPNIEVDKVAGGDGNSVLKMAVQDNQLEFVSLLLNYGAHVGPKDYSGATPLLAGACYPSIVNVLLAHGADVNATDYDGRTALMTAVSPTSTLTVKYPLSLGTGWAMPQSTEALRLLLAHGARVNTAADDGTTALIVAADASDLSGAALLLDHGADLEAFVRGNTFETGPALVLAAQGRHGESANILPMLRLLLDHGANPNGGNHDGETALMFRALKNDANSVRLLLDRGANPNVNIAGYTALTLTKSSQVKKLLLSHGAHH